MAIVDDRHPHRLHCKREGRGPVEAFERVQAAFHPVDGARVAPHESGARDGDGGRRADRGFEPCDVLADVRNHVRGGRVVGRRACTSDDFAGRRHRDELRERAADVDADGV